MASRQLQIAHDSQDEATMSEWLTERAPLLCLPANADVDAACVPRPLVEYDDKRLVVFLADRAELILEGGHISEKPHGTVVYSCSDNDGIMFEWERTTVVAGCTYVPTGGVGSRLYIRDADVPTPASDAFRKLVNSLFRWVRKSHPWVTEGRHPVFVGKSLGARVRSGQARLTHPNSKPLTLVPNPKHKE